ncbi:hypothetical protein RRG08_041271 [Elysia crispata]|uniref:Uncharacterized protein n=1 Tax=Elysia crispata TaxID=231223 RepID=A0AAE1AUJ4_9GAST|nr:hypothetical protein RRG08_041271 [Elysia crispata]
MAIQNDRLQDVWLKPKLKGSHALSAVATLKTTTRFVLTDDLTRPVQPERARTNNPRARKRDMNTPRLSFTISCIKPEQQRGTDIFKTVSAFRLS